MTIKAEPYTHDPLYSATTGGRTYTEEEPREYEKIYKNTTGKPKADTLLPCPFCGGKARYIYTEPYGRIIPAGWIECTKCCCRTAEVPNKDMSLEGQIAVREVVTRDWNRRAEK